MTYPKLRARPVHNGYVIQRLAPPSDALAHGRVYSPDVAIVLPGGREDEERGLAELFAAAPALWEALRAAANHAHYSHHPEFAVGQTCPLCQIRDRIIEAQTPLAGATSHEERCATAACPLRISNQSQRACIVHEKPEGGGAG